MPPSLTLSQDNQSRQFPSMKPHSLKAGHDQGTGPQDLMLVQAAIRGDRQAEDAVVARLNCIMRFVYRLNQTLPYHMPIEGLEDVVQQVYVTLWPKLSNYAGTSALETWVYGFCRNCLRAEARRRNPRLRILQANDELESQVGEEPGPEAQASGMEGLECLQEELQRLDPAEREVVELRHLQDWSFEQIARSKNLPASTIKDRCYRAMEKIRIRLKRRDVSA